MSRYSYRRQRPYPGHTTSHFIYCIELPDGVDKRTFCDRMEAQGVPVRPYFNLLTSAPHLRKYSRHCPVAAEVGDRTVALPFHAGLTRADALAIWAAFQEATQ